MNETRTGSRPAARGVGAVRHRRTFERLRQSPHRGRSGPVSVSFVAEKSWSKVEVGYMIGRAAGTAVARNRLRRRLRAILAGAAPSLPPGAFVVRAGPEAAVLSFAELHGAVRRALERAVDADAGRGRLSPTGPLRTGNAR